MPAWCGVSRRGALQQLSTRPFQPRHVFIAWRARKVVHNTGLVGRVVGPIVPHSPDKTAGVSRKSIPVTGIRQKPVTVHKGTPSIVGERRGVSPTWFDSPTTSG